MNELAGDLNGPPVQAEAERNVEALRSRARRKASDDLQPSGGRMKCTNCLMDGKITICTQCFKELEEGKDYMETYIENLERIIAKLIHCAGLNKREEKMVKKII